MRKAKLRFSPQEIAYCNKYGIMPDYHFEKLYKIYGGDRAGQIVNANMRAIGEEMRRMEDEKRQQEQAAKENGGFLPCDNTPFGGDAP